MSSKQYFQSFEILESYIHSKRIKKTKHPKFDIWIYNYTEFTIANRLWDDVTMACRSLILDENHQIIARGFPKFFNFTEPEVRIPEGETFEVFEKLDGSLILLFYYENEWIFASKGSFDNKQTKKAKEIMKDISSFQQQDLTYVYEIIYPENRIVVNYKSREELVYLTSFRPDGTEINLNKQLQISTYESNTTSLLFRNLQNEDSDKEGYVIRFSSGYRVKVKFLKYLENHRLHANLSPEQIKKLFILYPNLGDILCLYEEELHEFITKTFNVLYQKYNEKYMLIQEEYRELHSDDRVVFYKNIRGSKYRTILSYMYNKKLDLVRKEICATIEST
jgi:hypothetical protein